MKKCALTVLATVFAVALVATLSTTTSAVTAEETITGMLVEAGCAAMGGTNPSAEHVACMVRCAQNGDKLAEWMAKQVHATGETSQAGGELLLEVSTIEPVR